MTNISPDWKKEFIRGFVTYESGIDPNPLLRGGLRQDDILSFITSTLQQEREKIVREIRNLGDVRVRIEDLDNWAEEQGMIISN